MALNPEQIAALRDACGQIADPITGWLLRDAAERIAGAGKMTSTAAYEMYRANALGQSKRELKKFLKKQLGLSEREIRRLFQQAEMWSVRNDLERLKLGPFTWISPQLKEITNAAVSMATADFRNLTRSLGMVSKSGQVLPLQQFYRESMDFAFKQVFTGAADYETAIRQATAKMASQGLRVIDYQSGRHASIEAATRRNMMSAMGLLDEQITRKNHDLLGCDGWEISAHANSAPDHEPYQGRQYSDADYEQLNNSLTRRIGTLNCGHTASPIILGINSPQYSEEELEKFKTDNAQGITYQGRHYTGYEATQKQRQLETAIRTQKNRILVAEAAGDEKTLQTARIKYQLLNREYREFSKAAGLRTQDQRALVVGFGPGEAGRAKAGAEQYYQDWSKSIGVNASLGNLEKYLDVKYNDSPRYELLKRYARDVKTGWISPLSGFENYENLYNRIQTEIVGKTTSNGIIITGQSDHFMQRIIGTMVDPKKLKEDLEIVRRSGVTIEDVKNALWSGYVRPVVVNGKTGKRSQKFIGSKCDVSVNPDTGNLIQCNPGKER